MGMIPGTIGTNATRYPKNHARLSRGHVTAIGTRSSAAREGPHHGRREEARDDDDGEGPAGGHR